MSRRSRIHLDGVPLHIVQQRHNRELCFFPDGPQAERKLRGLLFRYTQSSPTHNQVQQVTLGTHPDKLHT